MDTVLTCAVSQSSSGRGGQGALSGTSIRRSNKRMEEVASPTRKRSAMAETDLRVFVWRDV
eukprot:942702-Rhodomonas_salina.1